MADWTAHKAAGNAAYAKGNLAEAATEYTAALGGDLPAEDRAVILCNRAQVQLRLGKNAEAVEDCTACLTLAPNNVKAMFRRATALEALGNKADALKDFREVARLDPAVADAAAAIRRLDPSSVPRRAAKGQPKKKVTKEEMTALMEADSRVSNTDRQLLLAKERQATADREKKVTEATLRAIADLPEETRLYDSIGKMFLVKPKPVLTAQLAEKIETASQTLGVCNKTLEYLGKQKADAMANFQELTKAIDARA